jgi:predicted RNA-binding Zn-ribbon protein involved in translation (DUF1610 family)
MDRLCFGGIIKKYLLIHNFMHLNCSACAADIEIPDTLTFFTCASCGTAQKVSKTDSAIYTETIAADSEAFAKAHLQAAQEQRRQQVINALLQLEDAWRLQETSFMVDGKLRLNDKNAQGAARIFMIIALGISVLAFGYSGRRLFNKENIDLFILAGLFIFWTLAIWQSIVNSEKKYAYRDAKAEFDLRRDELQTILAKLNRQAKD